jgi:uncharacterized cupin superfamily protein
MRMGKLDSGRKGERAAGHIKGVWHELGGEAGTRTIGVRRIEVAAGHFSTPAHEHGAEEEIFYVCGSGASARSTRSRRAT